MHTCMYCRILLELLIFNIRTAKLFILASCNYFHTYLYYYVQYCIIKRIIVYQFHILMDNRYILYCMVNNISFQGMLIDYGTFTLLCHRLCALTDIKLIHYCNGSCINNINTYICVCLYFNSAILCIQFYN